MTEPRRGPIKSYEDLEVYQRGMSMLKDVYALCKGLPVDERRRLGDQMLRASRSVPTNIAEGYARRQSVREFKRFLTIAMGSANEMEVHLRMTRDFGFADESECHRLIDEYKVIGKQLRRLIERWRTIEPTPASSLQPPAS
jgi:four helix bundle protein